VRFIESILASFGRWGPQGLKPTTFLLALVGAVEAAPLQNKVKNRVCPQPVTPLPEQFAV
jgi:hypothetical protein